MRRVARRLSATLEAHRLPQVASPFEFLLGDEILIADIAALLPDDLPPNGHVVGPLFWSGWVGPAPWLEELDGRPLVYVTMGSTDEAGAALVKILAALHDAAYNVVVSTGSLSLPADLQVPDHVHLFPTVPGATVAQRSKLIVHHGGHETLLQGLAAGVPSLILPANPDQILVAQQAAALGVGRSLWRPEGPPLGGQALEQMTPAQIRCEIDSVLADQDCARACESLRQEIETYRGPAEVVAILEEIGAK
jgi:UDP:flavonoid glycosyltransferase YjiC (YdhE family)